MSAALLAVCVGLLSDDGLSDDQKEFMEDYREGYDYNQDGLDHMEAGFSAYDSNNLETALSEFETAYTDFAVGGDVLGADPAAVTDAECPTRQPRRV